MTGKHFLKTLLILTSIVFSSCEKGLDTINVESKVFLPLAGTAALPAPLGESIYELGVYKSGVNQKSNLTVKMAIDQESLPGFLANNPGYELLPEKYYTIPSFDVLIPESDTRGIFKIHLRQIDETFIQKSYVLPVTIKDASGGTPVVDDQRTVFLTFTRYRNAFESKYKAYGLVTREESADVIKINEEVTATTVNANTISVKGAENTMRLYLTIQNDQVIIKGAPGSEAFNIQNTSDKTSTYTGKYDPVYQVNNGVFKLFYSYTLNGKAMTAETELKFWL